MKQLTSYTLIRLFAFLLQHLPHRAGLKVGTWIGRLAFRLIPRRRQIALDNLRHALGDTCSPSQIRHLARRSFEEMGKTFVEFLCFPRWIRQGLSRYVSVQGGEHVHQALAHGRGVIVFIGHLGNWELQALVYGTLVSNPSAIAFPLKNARLNAWVNACRGLTGLEIIPKRLAARRVLRHLRQNRVVGFIADQNAGREGVFIRFFGRLASASRGPVTLALRTGAPILISLDHRRPDGHHVLTISEPFFPQPTDDFERDVRQHTQCLMSQLEEAIRKDPAQWMWMHDRWKSRPDPEWIRKRAQRRGHEAALVE